MKKSHAYGSAEEMRSRMNGSEDDDYEEGMKRGRSREGDDEKDEGDFPKGRGEREKGSEAPGAEARGPTGHQGRAILEKPGPSSEGASEEDEDDKASHTAAPDSSHVDLSHGDHTYRPSLDQGRRTAVTSPVNRGLPPPPTAAPLAAHAMKSPQDRPGVGTGQTGPVPMGHGSPHGGLGSGMGGGMPSRPGGVSDAMLVQALIKNMSQSLGKGIRHLEH